MNTIITIIGVLFFIGVYVVVYHAVNNMFK
jgi:hypothetical protein